MSSVQTPRLLIVDDETKFVTVLCKTLANQGYETVGFNRAEDAIAALRERDFDVLLTDLVMPGMDGIGVLKEALNIQPHLAGIIMTGQGTVQTAVDAMKIGAFDYITKPFTLNTLLPILTRALELRRLRMENLQLRETVGIHELSQAIAFTLDTNTILHKMADAALQQCQADEVSIMLPTEDGSELCISVVQGEDREHLLGERVPIAQGIAGWVARNREPLTLHGCVSDSRFAPINPRDAIRSAISMPMLAGSKLVGVLNLNSTSSRRPLTLGQVKALSILANIAASALENARLYEQVSEAERKYSSIFENAVEGVFRTTPDGKFVTANPALARILGYESPEELIASVSDIQHQLYVDPRRRAEFTRLIDEYDAVMGFELQLYRKDGSATWVSETSRAVRDESGRLLHYEGMMEDINDRKRAEEEITARARQQAVVAELGQFALEQRDLSRLMDEAVVRVAQTLNVEYCKVLELLPDGEALLLRASVGWKDGLLGAAAVSAGLESQAGYTLLTDGPVVVEDLSTETRFRGPPLLHEHGIVSGMSVVIRGGDRPFGVLGAHSASPRAFSSNDVNFLKTVANVLGVAVERSRTDEAMREGEERYRDLIEGTHDLVQSVAPDGHFLFVNRAWKETLGYSDSDLLGINLFDIIQPESRAHCHEIFSRLLAGEPVDNIQLTLLAKDGKPILLDGAPTARYAGERVVATQAFFRNITERKHLEDQLRQSQKMEAIGRLAGGVAHDFNNLLTAIIGYSQLAIGRLDQEDPMRKEIEQIERAGQRAAGLTNQLLVFSRRQVLQPQVLDLNVVVADLGKMLVRLIGEDVELSTSLGPDIGFVMADRGQIEQIIMNLAVNSRDAMPDGGRLTIETFNADLDESCTADRINARPGPHVVLVISDNGSGIDKETQSNIFEPFFTTKEQGKGTGLGLSTVYGIVQQSGGHIGLYSELGKGATLIYLPRLAEPSEKREQRVSQTESLDGSETVLLVEDEDSVRELARRVLEMYGYVVLEAAGYDDTRRICDEYESAIHLMLTDVVMPGANGRELAQMVAPLQPEMKVLYMSGYTDDAIVQHGVLGADTPFLQKPFTPTNLARKVREVLDA